MLKENDQEKTDLTTKKEKEKKKDLGTVKKTVDKRVPSKDRGESSLLRHLQEILHLYK